AGAQVRRSQRARGSGRCFAERRRGAFVTLRSVAPRDRADPGDALRAGRGALPGARAEARPPVYLTPTTTDEGLAQVWFSQFEGAGLDGVIAKPLDGRYQPDKRVMFKIKHERTADCLVAGYRPPKTGAGPVRALLP